MYINVVVFNVHTASAAVLVVAAACLGLGHAFAGVLLVLLLLTYSRTRMLVAGLEVAVWLLLVNRRAERTALVPRRHRWPWAVARCFPSRPARVRPRSPSCGGGRARAARTRGSASLPCGGARFRFGTVRVGMRRVGARSTRAAPGAWRCGAALRAGCASTPHTVGGAGTSRTGPGHNMLRPGGTAATSAALPCGVARFRFGTVRGGMRRGGTGTSRARPGHSMLRPGGTAATSAALPCGVARFRFGTVRGGMRRILPRPSSQRFQIPDLSR